MALASKTTILLGSFLFAAGTLAACAGDGTDSTGTGNTGNTTGNNNTGNTTGTGNTSGGGNTSGTSSGGGITTVGGYHTSGTYKGYFWTSSDKVGGTGTSSISPANFETTPKICASGTAAKVPSETAYGTHWGALVGWNLNQGEMPPNDPVKVGLTGSITVGISGSKIPTGMRVKVAVGATDYCADIKSGSQTIPVSSLKKECWLTGGAAYGGEPVEAIAIQVTTNTTSETPFDFCVTELSVK